MMRNSTNGQLTINSIGHKTLIRCRWTHFFHPITVHTISNALDWLDNNFTWCNAILTYFYFCIDSINRIASDFNCNSISKLVPISNSLSTSSVYLISFYFLLDGLLFLASNYVLHPNQTIIPFRAPIPSIEHWLLSKLHLSESNHWNSIRQVSNAIIFWCDSDRSQWFGSDIGVAAQLRKEWNLNEMKWNVWTEL